MESASNAFQPIITALTTQFSADNIVTVVAAGLGAAVGIYFAWFAIRKLVSVIRNAFSRGKLGA